jgi:hypothetical protein
MSAGLRGCRRPRFLGSTISALSLLFARHVRSQNTPAHRFLSISLILTRHPPGSPTSYPRRSCQRRARPGYRRSPTRRKASQADLNQGVRPRHAPFLPYPSHQGRHAFRSPLPITTRFPPTTHRLASLHQLSCPTHTHRPLLDRTAPHQDRRTDYSLLPPA